MKSIISMIFMNFIKVLYFYNVNFCCFGLRPIFSKFMDNNYIV